MTNNNNARGIAVMLLSMLSFALADTLVKIATSTLSPAQVLFFLMGGGFLFFTSIAIFRGEPLTDRRAFQPVLLLRYVSEILGMIGMIMALTLVPLSTVGAITQAAPIFVAIGAVLFAGEKVSWRRWSAIALGFLGVLLIVQPGTEGFEPPVLWAVMSLLALAVRDLTTRLAPADIASASLAAFTMIPATPFAVGWVLWRGESLFPAEANWLLVLAMVSLGSLGYILLIASIRMAEVSVVTPFRYSRIIILLVLGALVFDERPNSLMLFGASLVILSGVYMVLRERRLQKASNNENADVVS